MGPVDDDGAKALRALLRGDEVSQDTRQSWARYLLAAHHRDAYRLAEGDADATRIGHDVMARMRARFGTTRDEWRRLEQAIKWVDVPEMARGIVRGDMVRQMRNEQHLERLLGMRWYLVASPWELITSDRPLLRNSGRKSQELDTLSMALSPTVLFVATPPWEGESDDEIDEAIRTIVFIHNFLLLEAEPRRIYSRIELADAPGHRLRTFVDSELQRQDSARRDRDEPAQH